MPEARAVRKKVVLRMLGHPVVLAPLIAGATAGAAAFAVGGRVGVVLLSVLAGSLVAVGTWITRLIADDGRTAQGVWKELEAEEHQSRQESLDDLDRRLTAADEDGRPEAALRDLRSLMQAFDELSQHESAVHNVTVVEMRSKVQQIFQQSLQSLEQTLKLGETAQRLLSPSARAPILEQRERLIAEIEGGTRQLGATLAALERLIAGGANQSELARLRDDLDKSLDLASTVEARLQALMNE